jgi:catechol 2,3-dioxygenase-like lactoylglutathione lyase family enzyme
MAIVLDHTIVPAHDKEASARFLARILGLRYEGPLSHFAPLQINDTLTFDFDNDTNFESHHYAFKVDETEFDAIFDRVRARQRPRRARRHEDQSPAGRTRLLFPRPKRSRARSADGVAAALRPRGVQAAPLPRGDVRRGPITRPASSCACAGRVSPTPHSMKKRTESPLQRSRVLILWHIGAGAM